MVATLGEIEQSGICFFPGQGGASGAHRSAESSNAWALHAAGTTLIGAAYAAGWGIIEGLKNLGIFKGAELFCEGIV